MLNDKQLSEVIAEAYKNTPPFVRVYIDSGEFEKFLEQLRTTHQFHVDVLDRISNEILMVLIGITEPTELPRNLEEKALVPGEILDQLIGEINTSVFKPLLAKEKQIVSTPTDQMRTSATPKGLVHTPREVAPPPNLPGAGVAEPNIGMPQAPAEPMVVVYAAPTPPPPAPAPTPMPAAPAAPAPAATWTRPIATPMPAAPDSSRPILKQYGVDPYKEPIE